MSTIKYRLERAEKFSGKQPFAGLTDEELDAKIDELSAKAGLLPVDEAIKAHGSLNAYIRALRQSLEGDSGQTKRPRKV